MLRKMINRKMVFNIKMICMSDEHFRQNSSEHVLNAAGSEGDGVKPWMLGNPLRLTRQDP